MPILPNAPSASGPLWKVGLTPVDLPLPVSAPTSLGSVAGGGGCGLRAWSAALLQLLQLLHSARSPFGQRAGKPSVAMIDPAYHPALLFPLFPPLIRSVVVAIN